MYPKVFVEFAKAADHYGPVSVLPTPVFFYGLPVGEEILVEIEKGKTLVVRTQAIGETDEDGFVRVFFELNGQPRIVKVPNRSRRQDHRPAEGRGGQSQPCRRTDAGRGLDARRPAGQAVKAGDVLLSIEAMKMETALHAERDGTIAEVLVHAGSQIDAKDLLLAFAG